MLRTLDFAHLDILQHPMESLLSESSQGIRSMEVVLRQVRDADSRLPCRRYLSIKQILGVQSIESM